MKYSYNLLLLATLLFLAFNTVNAKDRLTDDPKSEFTAKVNNKDWKANIRMCDIEGSGVELTGISGDMFAITLTLNGPLGEGVYEINKNSKNKASYSSVDTKYTVGTNDVGKVIITKYDKEKKLYSGTFELKLTNEKTGEKVNITEGKFKNLKLYDKPKGESEFKAKLNGENWNLTAYTSAIIHDTANVSALEEEKYLNIKFPKNTPPGEYVISAEGAYFAEYKSFINKDDAGLKPKTGKLIILKNDTKRRMISGQFEIEMVDANGNTKAVFTNGIFTMFYHEE